MAESRTEPLTGVDHAWLRMESPRNPMVITALLVLDGSLPPGHLEALLEERLLPFRRFKMRVADGGLLGAPRWVPDRRFDLRNHVIRETLPPPGGRTWLEARVGELFGRPLDRRRPLWDIHVFDGYEGGTALVCRFHHAIGDGMALLEVLLGLTDGEAGPVGAPPKRHAGHGFHLEDLLDAEKRAELLERGLKSAAALGRILLLTPDPATPFRGRLSIHKRTAWSDPVPLDEVKRIGKARGATINDVLQAAVSGALGRYLEARGRRPDGIDLRAVVPVDLRPPGRARELGNRFGLVFLDLPVGVRDPDERLAVTKRRMDTIKSSPEALAIFALLAIIGRASPRIEELALRIFGSKATAVMSNVPGPREVRTFAGRELRDVLFWVPESGGLGLGISFFSYRGYVRVGVVTDAALVPDPAAITVAFRSELERMAAATPAPAACG